MKHVLNTQISGPYLQRFWLISLGWVRPRSLHVQHMPHVVLMVVVYTLYFKKQWPRNRLSKSNIICSSVELCREILLRVKGNSCGSSEEQRRQWRPTPVLLPGKSHGRRSLEGCSPWGRWGSDTTERLHFHFSLSRIGEGNGNPLQCSCLENPRDGGAWWAAVYGVAQSRTRLKWLSSSIWRNCLTYTLRY